LKFSAILYCFFIKGNSVSFIMKILRTQSPFKESNPPARLNFLGFYLQRAINTFVKSKPITLLSFCFRQWSQRSCSYPLSRPPKRRTA
jgi:hypothetical protein